VTLPINTVVQADALQWCGAFGDGTIDAFWSSPPYNLDDPLRGGNHGSIGNSRWKRGHRYAGGKETGRGDGLTKPEPEYQDEQVAVLNQWYRALRDDGVAFYNHKVRIKEGRALSPLEWIYRTPFVLFQELVWNRGGTQQVDTRRFLPVSERIYVLTKRPGLILENLDRLPDVLYIPPTHHKREESGHPCPTPPAVVRACLTVLPRPKERRLLVADCYAGTGTTLSVAQSLGMDAIGCDQSEEYVTLANRRLRFSPTLLPLSAPVSAAEVRRTAAEGTVDANSAQVPEQTCLSLEGVA
jgi:site-specific DNA-methyltransferase (adenine-specific)